MDFYAFDFDIFPKALIKHQPYKEMCLVLDDDQRRSLLNKLYEIDRSSHLYFWSEADFFNSHAHQQCWILGLDYYHSVDNILGFAFTQVVLDEAEILHFVINKKYQGKRFGDILLKLIIQRLKNIQVCSIFLEVRENNIGAIKLYKNNDFEIISQRINYYVTKEGEQHHALVMKKTLISK